MENFYRKNCTIAVANYIIEKTNSYNESRNFKDQVTLTCKRIQKLLYFIEIEYMKRNNGNPLFESNFYAWPSGPVIPSVYTEYMRFKDGVMKPIIPTNNQELTQAMTNAIDEILEKTWMMDTSELVLLSREKRGPWERFYNPDDEKHEEVINKEFMYEFYRYSDLFFSDEAKSIEQIRTRKKL